MSTVENSQITALECFIYNEFLRITRTSQNKPWRPRKNFKDLDPELIIYLKKISDRLLQHKNINVEDYFFAPFYENNKTNVQLKFYASPQAVSVYVRYMKHLDQLPPDNKEMLKRVAQSLEFIKKFCKDNQLTLEEYFNKTEDNMHICLTHLKQRKIWSYCMLGFEEFDHVLSKCDKEIVKFMLGDDFFDAYNFKRTRFLNSTKCSKLVEQGKKIVEKQIKDSII